MADIIFGDAVPSGRLPVTFYRDGTQPPIEDYSMSGRTYRYFKGEPLYPFGYGLSYSSFEYSDLKVSGKGTDDIRVSVKVKNTGSRDADEIVQLYLEKLPEEKIENGLNNEISDLKNVLTKENQPIWSLSGFKRIRLGAGEEKEVTIDLLPECFDTVLDDGRRVSLKGRYIIHAGGQQPDKRSAALTGKSCLSFEFTV